MHRKLGEKRPLSFSSEGMTQPLTASNRTKGTSSARPYLTSITLYIISSFLQDQYIKDLKLCY